MEPEMQDGLTPDDEDLYAAPDVARLGTVEHLSEGAGPFAAGSDPTSVALG